MGGISYPPCVPPSVPTLGGTVGRMLGGTVGYPTQPPMGYPSGCPMGYPSGHPEGYPIGHTMGHVEGHVPVRCRTTILAFACHHGRRLVPVAETSMP